MSRTPEGKVKDYLKQRVQALGGELVFVKYVGRRNCPDIRVRFAYGSPFYSRNCWVETKAGKDGVLSSGQQREIDRMRMLGEVVLVLTTVEAIDREFPI